MGLKDMRMIETCTVKYRRGWNNVVSTVTTLRAGQSMVRFAAGARDSSHLHNSQPPIQWVLGLRRGSKETVM